MRQQPWTAWPALVVALLVAGCGAGNGDEAGDAPGAVPSDASGDAPGAGARVPADAGDGWQECVNDGGFVASYPQGWVTNDGSVMPACSLFDPEPFRVPEASEIPEDIAVSIHIDHVAWGDVAGSEFGVRILHREEVTVAGRRAIRRLVEHTGAGLYDRGLQTSDYVVDWGGGRTLIAASHDAGEPPFDEKRRVLDAMMERLRPTR